MKKRGVIKGLLALVLLFCFIFTIVCGGWILRNYNQAAKLWKITTAIDDRYIGELDQESLFDGVLYGMLDSLGDPYSVYLDKESAENLLISTSGTFGGIGVYVTMVDEKVVVSRPIKDGPSALAGIQSDDVIVQVNGEDIAGLSLDDVVAQMRGEVGTTVVIGIERPCENDKFYQFELTRAMIEAETVEGNICEENSKIGYIAISNFANNTDEAFVETLNDLIDQGIEGIVIDLRYNGGGSVDAACNIANLMIPEGPIVHLVDKNGNKKTTYSEGAQVHAPIAVLVNGYTASASEILSGALQDTGSAVLIGEKTYGKGIVQTVYFFKDGTGFKLTEAKYLTPNENDIHQKGIEPDIEVKLTPEGKTDTQYQKAIEYITLQLKK